MFNFWYLNLIDGKHWAVPDESWPETHFFDAKGVEALNAKFAQFVMRYSSVC